jgi:hypothetical protein
MVGQTERGKKRATNVEGITEAGQQHFALNNSDSRILFQVRAKRLEKIRAHNGIIVEQKDQVTGARTETQIVSAGKAQVTIAANHLYPRIFCEDLERIVRGTIIDNNHLVIFIGNCFKGFKAIGEKTGTIEVGNQDGDQRRVTGDLGLNSVHEMPRKFRATTDKTGRGS